MNDGRKWEVRQVPEFLGRLKLLKVCSNICHFGLGAAKLCCYAVACWARRKATSLSPASVIQVASAFVLVSRGKKLIACFAHRQCNAVCQRGECGSLYLLESGQSMGNKWEKQKAT